LAIKGAKVMDGPGKLLIVEDEPLIRSLLEDDLFDAGFQVSVAGNGREAMELLGRQGSAFTALVSDVRLGPGPDGWAVAKFARGIHPDIPVVYLTADSANMASTHAVSDAIVLQKPHQRTELLVALDLLLIDRSKLPTPDRDDRDSVRDAEALWSWAYVSRTLLAPQEMEKAIADIVTVSKRNNAAADVSGALMAVGSTFAQLIEGPRDGVERIKAAILADDRHYAIQTLAEGPVSKRRFLRWSLAYAGRSAFFQRVLSEAPILHRGSDRTIATMMARLSG
jgi:CheY-like chemotaxis protein